MVSRCRFCPDRPGHSPATPEYFHGAVRQRPAKGYNGRSSSSGSNLGPTSKAKLAGSDQDGNGSPSRLPTPALLYRSDLVTTSGSAVSIRISRRKPPISRWRASLQGSRSWMRARYAALVDQAVDCAAAELGVLGDARPSTFLAN